MDLSGYIRNIRKKVEHDRVIVAGAGVCIYKDGKVLLQKRKDNSFVKYVKAEDTKLIGTHAKRIFVDCCLSAHENQHKSKKYQN